MSWVQETLGVICLPTSWRDPRLLPDSVFEYIDISGVDRVSKKIAETKLILGSQAPSRARKVVATGDVLVSTVRPNLNTVAPVPEFLDGAVASTGFCVLRADSKRVLPRYLFYFTLSNDFVNFLCSRVRGASYPAVTDADVGDVPLNLPPVPEQRRIIEILDQAGRLRRLRSEADTKAEQIVPALFTQMFGSSRSCRATWTSQPLAQLLQGKKGSLQSGPFGSHLHNSDFVENGHALVVGIDNVHNSGFEIGRNRRVTKEKYSELRKFALEPGDVLITVMGSVGRTCVFPQWAGLAICSKHVYRIQIKRSLLEPEYLCDYLKYSTESRAQLGASATGQIVAGITSKALKEMQIKVPRRDLQADYVQRKKALTDTSGHRARAKDTLERLFGTLLHRAFTGDLTASWREAHMNELLQEMEQQAKALASLEAGR